MVALGTPASPAGRTAAIARENNDPLAQGRMLSPQEGGEGGAVQGGHRQVTHHHVVGALLELCQDVLAKAVLPHDQRVPPKYDIQRRHLRRTPLRRGTAGVADTTRMAYTCSVCSHPDDTGRGHVPPQGVDFCPA
jgi:hypothetical protein